MKRITAIALFAFAGILSAGNCLAQSQIVQANVPFDFIVGGKILPPGTYAISKISDDVIELQNSTKHLALLSVASTYTNLREKDNKLTFAKYGDQYFLREIHCESAAMDLNLPATKSEKVAREQEAMLHNESLVLVAVK
jgi:hypothetical protein